MLQIDRYVLIGNPVAHSKSPYIHAAFAKQTEQHLNYGAIEVPLEGFNEGIAEFRKEGGKGCNITTPFKEAAWLMADERSAFAERAGAVNTLMFRDDGSVFGANTDGTGLLRDLLLNHKIHLAGKRILLLGAGGAVRGVLEPLLSANPEALFIANRTAQKAVNLTQDFADFGKVSGGGFDAIAGQFDLIINGTAASLQGDVPPLPLNCMAADGVCYDMMYGAEPTAFLRWGQANGAAQVFDGLGMLVEQAADAFEIWRGVRPETTQVFTKLSAMMAAR